MMALLILGLVIFIGTHSFTMMRAQRAAAIARLGENGYKGIYSLLVLIGLVLIWVGFGQYRADGYIQIWWPPIWTQHLSALFVLVAFILLPAAYMPGYIKAKAKHPMLAAVKIWAFAHLLANGDLGSIILFGSLLGWAVVARISTKRRTDAPSAISAPVTAPQAKYDVLALVIGVGLYLAFVFWLHRLLIGVPVFGI
jgi:uncharacterized membrane protein